MTTLIIGAGVAGALLARELGQLGEQCIICDAGSSQRASAVPAALLHAHPGRSLAASADEQEAFSAAWQAVERWSAALPNAVWTGAMVRPLEGSRHADKLAASLPDSCEIFEPDALVAAYPALSSVRAARYAPAATLDLGRILDHEIAACEAAGARVLRDTSVARLARSARGWRAWTSGGLELEAERLALACGAGLTRWLPELGLGLNGGELGVWEASGADLGCAISGGGHVAPMADGRWAGGSTYLRVAGLEEAPREDAVAEAELRARLSRLVPAMADARCARIWRGVRVSAGAERRPLAGPVPGEEGLWVFGALGSRGVFWAPWLARRLAAHMLDPTRPTPALARIERLVGKQAGANREMGGDPRGCE